MKYEIEKIIPKGLVARFIFLFLSTLIFSQVFLFLALQDDEREWVREIIFEESLAKITPLIRLNRSIPVDKLQLVLEAFQSDLLCINIATEPPIVVGMSPDEQELSKRLSAVMLNSQIEAASVSIGEWDAPYKACGSTRSLIGLPGPRSEGSVPSVARTVTVSITVAFAESQWLHVESVVVLPSFYLARVLAIFLISLLVVGAVAITTVAHQTRSLRVLADASTRFGRGETVAALPEKGPAEVVAATRAFNVMQSRLDTFIKDRIRFLGALSHDLRTPLTTLRLKVEFIEDAPTRDGIIATIEELIVICEETLAFSRAEAPTEPARRIDLRVLLEDICAEFQNPSVLLVLDDLQEAQCHCRPITIKRAMRNLVENALRHGDRVNVSCWKNSGSVFMRVTDNGPGIDPNKLEAVFEPFVRLDGARNPETGGVGLGLAISRGIIRSHGGVITLRNLPDGGLCADIRLPAEYSSQYT